MNQNEPIFLNLYIRDTESYRKNTKIVGNKQIMRVKKLISFYEILHFFSILRKRLRIYTIVVFSFVRTFAP